MSGIDDRELNAYVDGQLSPEREREVEAYLAQQPEMAARVQADRLLNQRLHALYDPVLAEPHAVALPAARPRRLPRVAAALAWLAVGGAGGWMGHAMVAPRGGGLEAQLVAPASFAHLVYTTDPRHPVEVTAQETEHLEGWLSRRLHTEISAPDFSGAGFRLLGGRLLPATDRMAAQFMYENDAGRRITLYARRGNWGSDLTAFRYASEGALNLFYWIDGPLGYALVGELGREELRGLAESVHRQRV